MYNGGNTDGYGGAIQSHGGSRYSPYGNNATQSHLQAKDMVSFFIICSPVPRIPVRTPYLSLTCLLGPDSKVSKFANLELWSTCSNSNLFKSEAVRYSRYELRYGMIDRLGLFS